jgi:hypothetical protein
MKTAMKKGPSPLPQKTWMIGLLCLGLLPGCGLEMPDFSTGAAAAPAPVVSAVPRGPDPLGDFAETATPGSVGFVNGERARLVRAYNAASGRECREIILGSGTSERAAVACRSASGQFVSSTPLLRGSFR